MATAFLSTAPIISGYVFRVKIRYFFSRPSLGGHRNPPVGGQQDGAHWKKISASRCRRGFVLVSMNASCCPEQKSNQDRRCQITPSPPKRSFSAFLAIFQNFSVGCSGLKFGWIRRVFANYIRFKSNLSSGGTFGPPTGVFNKNRPIENRSQPPDVVETSFWALWTRLDALSKSQIRSENVRSPLHPLTGGWSSDLEPFLAFSIESQGGPNV